MEGNLPFLLSFTLYLRAISKYKSPAGYIWRGDLTKGFLRYDFGGLIFEGAYTWRRLFSEFYGIFQDELQARISLKAFFFTNNVITNYFSERSLSSRGQKMSKDFLSSLPGQINCLKSYKCA